MELQEKTVHCYYKPRIMETFISVAGLVISIIAAVYTVLNHNKYKKALAINERESKKKTRPEFKMAPDPVSDNLMVKRNHDLEFDKKIILTNHRAVEIEFTPIKGCRFHITKYRLKEEGETITFIYDFTAIAKQNIDMFSVTYLDEDNNKYTQLCRSDNNTFHLSIPREVKKKKWRIL